jgi:multidrug efflux pump subunit AcrA (membrane-fusion protein)
MANPKKRSRGWFLLALLPVLGAAAFFSVRALSRTPPKIDADKLVKVERMDLARSVVATGKIEPTTKVEIKSKASGIILKLPVNVGDRVHQGQTICELDQNDLLPRVRQAQAALGMAEAALKSTQAEYERAKVEAEGPDVPFLKKDMERAREMFQEKVAPRATTRRRITSWARTASSRRSSIWEWPRRRFVKPKRKWNNRARRSPPPKRTCATPPSCRPSTAWCSRAIARWAMRSARSSPWGAAPRSS